MLFRPSKINKMIKRSRIFLGLLSPCWAIWAWTNYDEIKLLQTTNRPYTSPTNNIYSPVSFSYISVYIHISCPTMCSKSSRTQASHTGNVPFCHSINYLTRKTSILHSAGCRCTESRNDLRIWANPGSKRPSQPDEARQIPEILI